MFNPIGMAATYSKLTAHTFRGLSYFTLRFGQHGAEHYNNELTQRSEAAGNNFKNTYQYWLNRGLSETESQQAVSTEQSRRSLLRDRSLEHSTRTHAHWVAKGYTDTDATEIVHNIQSRAASFFVEKYGTDQGMLRYKKMIDDRTNTYYEKDDVTRSKINQSRGRTYQQLADTHGAAAASNIISRRTSLMHGFSEEANKFFYQLDQILTDDQREQSYTAYKTNEWFVRHNDGILFVDYKLENVIIEYNGSFWHGDSRIFADNDIHPVTKQPIAEMQDRDRRKTKILENKQFHVLSIWSLDSQADIQTQLKKCKDFINDYL
jgi:G:T-mismatch repair DNA endonuclease (very short patch repair protein)